MYKILLIAALLLASCAGQAGDTPQDGSQRVISLGPSVTEILVDLGLGHTIVAMDEHSADIAVPAEVPLLSVMPFDAEQLLALAPDRIFVHGIVRAEGDDPLRIIEESGIEIIDIPVSTDVAGIAGDIRMVAEIMGVQEVGEALISEFEAAVEELRYIGQGIVDRRTVYFELEPAPMVFSFGRNTFLHEMLEIVGAENIFADQEYWVSVSDEVLLAADPDVILTNVGFIDEPLAEIASRPGWSALEAVREGRIYQISTNPSSRPTHNSIIAMREIAEAVYPEHFPAP